MQKYLLVIWNGIGEADEITTNMVECAYIFYNNPAVSMTKKCLHPGDNASLQGTLQNEKAAIGLKWIHYS